MKTSTFVNLPKWARWCAMDADGAWWCYEVEPLQYHKGWYENEVGRSARVTDPALAAEFNPGDWPQSLQSVICD